MKIEIVLFTIAIESIEIDSSFVVSLITRWFFPTRKMFGRRSRKRTRLLFVLFSCFSFLCNSLRRPGWMGRCDDDCVVLSDNKKIAKKNSFVVVLFSCFSFLLLCMQLVLLVGSATTTRMARFFFCWWWLLLVACCMLLIWYDLCILLGVGVGVLCFKLLVVLGLAATPVVVTSCWSLFLIPKSSCLPRLLFWLLLLLLSFLGTILVVYQFYYTSPTRASRTCNIFQNSCYIQQFVLE